jgi:hypothetical protein
VFGNVDSLARIATRTTRAAPFCNPTMIVVRRSNRTAKHTAATEPHATGGASRNERSENAPIPSMLPMMSRRYASRGSNVAKVLATPSAIVVMISAVATKITGNITHMGSPDGRPPK